jgi:hypothetical protein
MRRKSRKIQEAHRRKFPGYNPYKPMNGPNTVQVPVRKPTGNILRRAVQRAASEMVGFVATGKPGGLAAYDRRVNKAARAAQQKKYNKPGQAASRRKTQAYARSKPREY